MPTHVAMVRKPLYHGAIDIHGAAPSPDNTMIATTGRGTSNVYLVDTATMRVIGNPPNPQAGPTTNPERLTSGGIVGREPHAPTLVGTARNCGSPCAAKIASRHRCGARPPRQLRGARRRSARILADGQWSGPGMVLEGGALAFVASQKTSQLDVFETSFDRDGRSHPKSLKTVDIRPQDPGRLHRS